MVVRGVFTGTLAVVFSFLLAKVVYTSEDHGKTETPLQCYDCNSRDDPRCGDPFNSYSIGTVNCSDIIPPEHLVNLEDRSNGILKPTVCRKLVQKVENQTKIIRKCGYIQDDYDDKRCVKRSGTKNVQVIYCSCSKSLCNAGLNIRPSLFTLIVVLLPIINLSVS